MIKGYDDNKLPLDTVWLDIPYLDAYADFSVNKTAFPNLKAFVDKLHNEQRQIVVILDAGLSADDPENKYYKMA